MGAGAEAGSSVGGAAPRAARRGLASSSSGAVQVRMVSSVNTHDHDALATSHLGRARRPKHARGNRRVELAGGARGPRRD